MAFKESWANIAEVAVHPGVAKDAEYRWAGTQGLLAHRVGWLFRFRLSQVEEWVETGANHVAASHKPGRTGTTGRNGPDNG